MQINLCDWLKWLANEKFKTHDHLNSYRKKKTFDKDQHSFMIKISEQNRHRKKFLQHNGGHL
jgi:hypothetical protein